MIEALVERLAQSAMLTDWADRSERASVAEQLAELSAADSLPETVRREADSVRAALETQGVDGEEVGRRVQEFVAGLQRSAVDSAGSTSASDDSSIDLDLLETFLASCDEGLQDLEGQLLALEEGQVSHKSELESIRRRVHTLKGESGVLSLDVAQRICHLAEEDIDRCEERGRPLPMDLLLALVDWFRRYLLLLAENPTSPPPDADHILRELEDRAAGKAENETVSEVEGDPSPAADPVAEAAPVAATEPATSNPEPAAAESSSAPAAAGAEPPLLPDASEPVEFPADTLADETFPDFLDEARQHLEEAEAALLEWENQPDDREPIDRLFRGFHTIKGVAGFYDLEAIVRLAHSTEALLDEFRKERLTCEPFHIDLTLRARDLMARLVDGLTGGEVPLRGELAGLVWRLEQATKGEPIAEESTEAAPDSATAADAPSDSNDQIGKVGEVLRSLHLDRDEDLEEAIQKPETVVRRLGEVLVEKSLLRPEALREALERQEQERTAGRARPLGEILVDLGLIRPADLELALKAQGDPAPKVQRLLKAQTTESASSRSLRKKLSFDTTVKVNTQRLDTLVDMVGELVIAEQMVTQDPLVRSLRSEAVTRNLAQMAKITRDLQEAAMSLRMVTLKSTFQKMARLVRDVSAKAKRKVRLVLTGEDTELDRNVVEEISDPLVHLLRNAIDHGLEPPSDRVKVGKAEEGVLELKAYHQGGSIVIDVIDDGRGLDRDRIFEKAASKGLLAPDQRAEDLTDSDVYKMIFLPGFSTAEQVTDISGRGVGMDVVRRNIEAMRGKIEISSTAGRGSVFSLRLPLTLAIIEGMVVRVGHSRFVIPILAIEQSMQPGESQLYTVLQNGEMAKVRGDLVPIHRLRDIFHLSSGETDAEKGILVLVDAGGSRACLLVDEIVGHQQVVIKSLGRAVPSMTGISGGTILGDGQVALILDIDGMLATPAAVAT